MNYATMPNLSWGGNRGKTESSEERRTAKSKEDSPRGRIVARGVRSGEEMDVKEWCDVCANARKSLSEGVRIVDVEFLKPK